LLPCCCIWLSGPEFQDLDIWLSRLAVTDSRDRYLALTTNSHRLTITDWRSQTDGRMDATSDFIYKIGST
jgi:hypothetical protein